MPPKKKPPKKKLVKKTRKATPGVLVNNKQSVNVKVNVNQPATKRKSSAKKGTKQFTDRRMTPVSSLIEHHRPVAPTINYPYTSNYLLKNDQDRFLLDDRTANARLSNSINNHYDLYDSLNDQPRSETGRTARTGTAFDASVDNLNTRTRPASHHSSESSGSSEDSTRTGYISTRQLEKDLASIPELSAFEKANPHLSNLISPKKQNQAKPPRDGRGRFMKS
jgi:hypothetical protein